MEANQTYDLFHKEGHNLNPEYDYPEASSKGRVTRISKDVSMQEAPKFASWVSEDRWVNIARQHYPETMPTTGLTVNRDSSWPPVSELDTLATYVRHIATPVHTYMRETHKIDSSIPQSTAEHSMTPKGVQKVSALEDMKNKYVIVRPDGVYWTNYTDDPSSADPGNLDPNALPPGAKFFPHMEGGRASAKCQPYAVFEGERVGILDSCGADLKDVAMKGMPATNRNKRRAHERALKRTVKSLFKGKTQKLLKQALAYAKAFGVDCVVMYDYKTMALFRFPELQGLDANTKAKDTWMLEVTHVEVTLIEDRAKMVPALAGFFYMARRNTRARPTAGDSEGSAGNESQEGSASDELELEGNNQEGEEKEDEEDEEDDEAEREDSKSRKRMKH